MNEGTLCAMHHPDTGSTRGPLRGEKGSLYDGVWGVVCGVWWVIAHGEACEALQDCIVTALTPTGLGPSTHVGK